MSNATDEHIRDARQAHGELATSLSILGDKLSEVRTALSTVDLERAQRALDKAVNEIDAAHGYLAAARDSHQSLGRCLNQVVA
jgi:hypothetical protein